VKLVGIAGGCTAAELATTAKRTAEAAIILPALRLMSGYGRYAKDPRRIDSPV
jgi:hypothetical protein